MRQWQLLFPDNTGLTCPTVELTVGSVFIQAVSTAACGICPKCHLSSRSIHSHYLRTLADLPWQGQQVTLQVQVRKFFCRHAACAQSVFTERIPLLMSPYARRTLRLVQLLEQVGVNTGGEVGSRLAESSGIELSGSSMLRLIRRISVSGYAPHLRLGGMTLFDRREIEAVRNLRTIIGKYLRREEKGKKPLSLAVFGTPGSGKSFAVKQLANCLGMDILEFNLSQFDQPADLIGAFHQVRDKVLEGNTPCVFWDEFDSQDYKWLQYLLAPMQDGKFQQGEITHPIGKCVFVFAGGTSYTFAEFGKFMIDTPDGKQKDTIKEADFKMKKGPDFISRLSGYLNIKGINDLCTDDGNDCQPPDVMIPIRRAQLIRNMLGVKGNETLNIDPGLLNALIRIKKNLS